MKGHRTYTQKAMSPFTVNGEHNSFMGSKELTFITGSVLQMRSIKGHILKNLKEKKRTSKSMLAVQTPRESVAGKCHTAKEPTVQAKFHVHSNQSTGFKS